jgi:protein SCO1
MIFDVLFSGCAKRYPVRGMVVRTDTNAATALISHGDIGRYMPAMTMPFRVRKPGELAGLSPGAQVEFELVVRRSGSHIERLRRIGPDTTGVALPANPDEVAIGAKMPDFELTDQLGRAVRLSDFRGKVVAVDFIYTRCPLPDVCPRLSAQFKRLHTRFGAQIALLSITIDPQYDTPEVLLRYAKVWAAQGDDWRFLTGPDADIERVGRRFGMNFWPEEGLIAHTSETSVISRDGSLSTRINGPGFAATQLGDLIAHELESK